jgi:hypothetical protein
MKAINSPQGGENPVLVTDIDGVFLVADEEVPGRCPPDWEASPRDRNRDRTYEFYNPRHGEWMKEILPDVDWYWLTSHNGNSHRDIGRHLYLPETDWIDLEPFDLEQRQLQRPYDEERDSSNLNYARRKAIDTFFSHRALAWVEDELTPLDYHWAWRRKANEAPTLLVRPDSAEGLQYSQIHRIKAWLGQLATI